MWQTDITELVENMERLKENRTELAERNYLEQQNYEVERKINALREKNRLYDLLQRQRSRKPSGAFFVGRTARSGRKKQGCSTSLRGSPVWLRGVGARASGVLPKRVRLSARVSFPPEPPGCFPGSARASARC